LVLHQRSTAIPILRYFVFFAFDFPAFTLTPTKTGTCFDIHDGPTSTELRILLKIHLHSAIPSPAIWQWPRKLPTTQSPAIPYGSASIEVRKRLNIQARSTTQ
jgi:hypothetical protein